MSILASIINLCYFVTMSNFVLQLSRYFAMDLELAFPSVQLHSCLRFLSPSSFYYNFLNLIYPFHWIILDATEVCLTFCIGTGNQMVINFLRWEYCKSEKALLEWPAPVQVTDGWSTICSMATAATTISPSYLCWSSHVTNWFIYLLNSNQRTFNFAYDD